LGADKTAGEHKVAHLPNHDRVSTELTSDFRELVQWAFGPDGFPALRLIAFGDFSSQGRYLSGSVLLWRQINPNETRENFCPIEMDDLPLLGLGDSLRDFMEACPTDAPYAGS
jgi:hypothetical protein